MKRQVSLSELAEFYKQFQEVNPFKTLLLLIISLGIYAPNWIYHRNRDFEMLTAHAPSSDRGALVMFFFPVGWALTGTVLELFYNPQEYPLFMFIDGIIWLGLLFLALLYLRDFCKTYGEFTFTDPRLWFFFFFLGTLGILGLAIWNFYLIPFTAFFFVSIPAMQEGMNQQFQRYQTRRMYYLFYNR